MIRSVAALVCCFIFISSHAQIKDHTDSVRLKADSTRRIHRLVDNNIFQFFRNAITHGHVDSEYVASTINTKSESPFQAYEGKIIRKIIVKGYGFEQSFSDTSKRLQYFGTQALNKLHRKTRDWFIRNSLFIKENTPLSSFRLADNERLIRNLNFIQDARILVNYLPDNTDSVDLVVIVKDLFTINGELRSLGVNPTSIRGNVSEDNFLGMGQRIQGGVFVEQNRDPNFGYQLLYNKYNIGHSFVNAALSYTQINNDLTNGTPDETAWYIRLDRPLYAPYAHLAGGFNIGHFQSFNRYNTPDSFFFKYHYYTHDIWIGYNLGGDRFVANTSVRDRKFISFRYFQNHFYEVPFQIGDKYNWRFNDREAWLTQFTFFRQDFYKTNYIYGFGTTEDVPQGYNVALTTGWYKQLALKRPYAGVDANFYVVSSKGSFIQYFARAGTYWNKGSFQDAAILGGASWYSPLFRFDRVKIRQYVNVSYTRQFNRLGVDPLTINNIFGLRYFHGDSTMGTQRMTLHSETTFWLNYKLLGFKFAPFAFGDLSMLTPEKGLFSRSSLYHGLGAGMRARNENLVFNTIELRAIYFPRPTFQNRSFRIDFTTGIQFRYQSTYVRPPDTVLLNTDGLNSIY